MRYVLSLLLAILLILPTGGAFAADEPRTATISAMGGIPVNISAWGVTADAFEQAVARIAGRIEQLEAMMSIYRPESAVSRINRGEPPEPLPRELTELLGVALDCSQTTDGAFDITVKPLVDLWRLCAKEDRLPADAELEAALTHVGYGQLRLEDGRLALATSGVMLDLGGIAKGYFADAAVAILREAGAQRCLVDCGGDVVTWQVDTAGEPFHIGVRHPLGAERLLAFLHVPAGAVVTSGNYERFCEIGGKRYCHILDPRTGRPVEGMLSVTLLAPSGTQADALATAVFVMGPQDGARFVEGQPGIEALIAYETEESAFELYVSPGLLALIEFAGS